VFPKPFVAAAPPFKKLDRSPEQYHEMKISSNILQYSTAKWAWIVMSVWQHTTGWMGWGTNILPYRIAKWAGMAMSLWQHTTGWTG
jgi:hypothetical protein